MRGFPLGLDLHFVDILKRVVISSVRLIVKLPFTPKRLLQGISIWMGEVYRATFKEQNRKELVKYCISSREVRRVLLDLNPFEDSDWVRYIVEIWETDQAYRFRGQDIFPEVDKESLMKTPRKEILRLADLLASREIIGGQTPKIAAIRKILSFALLFKGFRNPIKSFLEALDMEKIKFTINDQYWCANKFDYNYEGKTYEQRMAWRNEEDKNWISPTIEPEKPRLAVNQPNQAFYDLPKAEATKMAEEVSKALIENWKTQQA